MEKKVLFAYKQFSEMEDFVNIFISYSNYSTQYEICHNNKTTKGCSDVFYYAAVE